jgi:lipopolysaccharide/colanic/teichoic acid biosynthesis glycosyltransferase
MTSSIVPRPSLPLRSEAPKRPVAAGRAVDIFLAGAGLVVLSALMACIAAAILLDGGGSVIFSQLRLGLGGKPFRLYKFRKFDENKGAGGGALTLKDDPRLSRFGRLLARAKLDELPQLWNVLGGDMALVGPRPETLVFADCFDDGHLWALDYKPGIFGPAQVFFRNEGALFLAQKDRDLEQFYREIVFPLKARIDRAYYPQRTLLRDIRWILLGILAVLGRAPSFCEERDLAAQVDAWIYRNCGRRAAPPLEDRLDPNFAGGVDDAASRPAQ